MFDASIKRVENMLEQLDSIRQEVKNNYSDEHQDEFEAVWDDIASVEFYLGEIHDRLVKIGG